MQTDSCFQNLILTIDDREEASRLKRAGDTQRGFPGIVWEPEVDCFRAVSEAEATLLNRWEESSFLGFVLYLLSLHSLSLQIWMVQLWLWLAIEEMLSGLHMFILFHGSLTGSGLVHTDLGEELIHKCCMLLESGNQNYKCQKFMYSFSKCLSFYTQSQRRKLHFLGASKMMSVGKSSLLYKLKDLSSVPRTQMMKEENSWKLSSELHICAKACLGLHSNITLPTTHTHTLQTYTLPHHTHPCTHTHCHTIHTHIHITQTYTLPHHTHTHTHILNFPYRKYWNLGILQ